MSRLFDPPKRVIRALSDRVSFVSDGRVLLVALALGLLGLFVLVLSMAYGRVEFSLSDVITALLGGGERRTRMVILEWRLPRALAALVLGALLGLGGAIFQSVTRNPLGSPDIVGFDAGAYTGALIAIMIGGGGWVLLAGSAVGGGLATGAMVYLLAWRQGVSGFQLIVIGIGISAMLTALNQWILLMLPLGTAMAAGAWATGTLSRVTGEQATFILAAGLPVVAFALVLSRRMRILEMGDERAQALGIAVEPLRLLLMILAVVATALSTAIAGPIPFIALAAPQIAHLLTRSAGTTLLGAMATGAALLLMADFIAQRVIAPEQIPVGLVTLCIGGGYFLWLLLKEARR
ncbi:FecCD family ABC transporter permease [Aureimonas populi]|uniref:FecCD family ABC transporter permease n=1 Tax=Aureimonas populi TaxID=1701758 RepID=A0ABW5CMF7_9HYPH|nr:iron chelate uptake ABC transporter family permease subunit [Aureimonas populi]